MPGPLVAAIPGLIQAGASLFGAGKRRRAEEQARERFQQQQANLENFQFENPYANQENVYEDATVNQQATQVQQQTAAQNQANLADLAAQGLIDPSKVASAQLQSQQQIGADLARQEQGIQQRALGEQSRLNQQEAAGAAQLQQQQHGQVQQQFNLAQQDLSQAQAARQQARQQLVSGLASAAGGAIGAIGGGAGGAAAGAGGAAAGAGGAGGAADFSSFTQQGGGLNFDPSSPFPRNGDGPTIGEYDKKTGKFAGLDEFRNKTGRINTGQGRYGKLRALYGDSSYAPGGEDSKRLGDTAGLLADRAAYQQKHGLEGDDFGAFHQSYGEYDSELGRKYLERQLATRARVEEDEAAFRAGQDEAFGALDDATRRGDVANLENKLRKNPELWRQLTGDTAARNASGDVFRQVFNSPASGPRDLNIDQYHQVLSGLEKAGVNPKEYLRFLNTDSPAKRTPLYRMFKMKWKGMYK